MLNKRIRLFLGVIMAGLVLIGGVKQGQVRAQTEAVADEVVAAEATVSGETEEAVMMEKATETEAIDYYLSYPGILPDHPLYWLKMIRDRVQLWLTTKPLAKAEKLLLYADKRLGAGWALIEGNKVKLGVTTLTKGEKYLERARVEAGRLGEEGKELKFREKFEKAMMKHEEVLLLLKEKLGEEHQEIMGQMLEAVKK